MEAMQHNLNERFHIFGNTNNVRERFHKEDHSA